MVPRCTGLRGCTAAPPWRAPGDPCDNRRIASLPPPRRLGPGLWLLLGFLGVLALLAFALQPDDRFTQGGRPHGDGLYHYAQVRSLVLDGDLRLADDYARLGNPHHQPVRADGWAGNHFTLGTALVWVSSFVVAHAVSRLGDAAGVEAMTPLELLETYWLSEEFEGEEIEMMLSLAKEVLADEVK